MPNWIGSGGGAWNRPQNWSGGVPDAAGAMANFSFSANGMVSTVTLSSSQETTVGFLFFQSTGTLGLTLVGGGAGSALVFNNGGSVSGIVSDTVVGGNGLTISGASGLTVRLDSFTYFDVINAGTSATIGAPISGVGGFAKASAGTLYLTGLSNIFSGGLFVDGGTLDAAGDGSLGSGAVTISNAAVLVSQGTVDNSIGTVASATGSVGTGRIAASANQTLTLTGALNHASKGSFIFGNVSDSSTLFPTTIVASFSSVAHNATLSSMQLAGGTLKLGTALAAATLFDFAGSGATSITGGILDTGGFAATISNLNMSGGMITSTGGALNLTLNHNSPDNPFQYGSFQGTAGVDLLTFNGSWVAIASTFSNWTSGVDIIQINGTGGVNNLGGSYQADEIWGYDGDDFLFGWGGADTIDGGNGNDIIFLIGANSGAMVTGNAGTDILQIMSGGSLSGLAVVSGFEGIKLENGASLRLTAAQFAQGFAANSMLSGTGSIIVDLSPGNQSLIAVGMTVQSGSTVALTVNGSSSNDLVKASPGTASTIIGDAGNDRLNGGNLADTISAGADIDKLRGGGGADLLTGGSGADVFKYRVAGDSGTGSNADIITDFVSGTDKLNFSRIDTNPSLAGDQGFAYIGTAAFGGTGTAQIRYIDLGNDIRVEADVDGNGIADMHIILQGAGAGAGALNASDFVL